MRIVINKCYGGFSVSEELANRLGLKNGYCAEEMRTDERLIEAVLEDREKASGECARLAVVDVPDEATDWRIDEYDGFESITYVLNGKMYEAY